MATHQGQNRHGPATTTNQSGRKTLHEKEQTEGWLLIQPQHTTSFIGSNTAQRTTVLLAWCEWHRVGWEGGGLGDNRGWDLPHQRTYRTPPKPPARFLSFHLTSWQHEIQRVTKICHGRSTNMWLWQHLYNKCGHQPITCRLHYTNRQHTHLSFMLLMLDTAGYVPVALNCFMAINYICIRNYLHISHRNC